MKVMNNNIFAPFAEGIGYGATVTSTTPSSSPALAFQVKAAIGDIERRDGYSPFD
jgi:hypothetical protein